jgi:predicted nucleotidyltransferase
MIDLIRIHRDQIAEICRRCHVQRLEVFGSAATGDFDPARSDVDFIAEFEGNDVRPGLLSRYLSLAEQLEGALGHRIDLLTPACIRNRYFRETVDASRELVYEGSR